MNVLIIIPTYNERENIGRLVDSIFYYTAREQVNILVVDDNSPDGTASVVKNLMQERYKDKLFIMERDKKEGLAAAYIAGFRWGLERDYDLFVEMDADFSHNPMYLPEMINIAENYDFVVGSRYVGDGGVLGWGYLRKLISTGGSFYSSMILGIPIKDLTGGFNFWKRSTLEMIGLDTIVSKGFLFQVELKYRAYKKNLRFVEYPIVFENREKGKSKMSIFIFFEALFNIWRLRFIRDEE